MKLKDYTFLDGWRLRETQWKPEEESAKATVFALANGYMGSRGAFEEADPMEPGVVGNYVNGIYDTPLGKLTEREIVNIPDWHHITLDVDGERFDMRTGEVLDYWRELDMREGILRRHVRWKNTAGKTVTIDTERFLSMARQHSAALRYRVEAESGCTICLSVTVPTQTSQRWACHTLSCSAMSDVTGVVATLRTIDPGYEVSACVCLEAETPIASRPRIEPPPGSSDHGEDTGGWRLTTELPAGGASAVTLFGAVMDSRTNDAEISRLHRWRGRHTSLAARRIAQDAVDLGYEALKAEHIARWAKVWEPADVAIEGDDDAQLGIRFSIFHILASAPWWSDRVSIPARGLQGQDYYGSIFWDCEIFCLPMLMASHPEAARNALGYRYNTLNGARRKSNNYGFDGAFYAWQSQETGDDQCALYVFTNPFTGRPMRAPFSDQQVHISADIVYALWEYYLATGDKAFIWESGLEVCLEVARFFATRCDRDPDGSYHLRGVLGPDEYHEAVEDDAYTNALVRRAFDVALYFHSAAEREQPDALADVARKIRLTDAEIAAWKAVRDRLYISQPNADGVIEQFSGYFGLEDCAVEAARARLAHPDLHPGGPLGPFQSTQVIKQADVVMMLYLLRDQYSPSLKRSNWQYYETRTAHDSSLSPMAYSLVAADVGLTDYAYRYFIQTAHIDLASYGPHWNLGIHAAGLGGAWMALIHGFCQISRAEDALVFRAFPDLPAQWSRVSFQYMHVGKRVQVAVTHDAVALRHVEGEGALDVVMAGERRTLEPGGETAFQRA
ncbi:MAG TPA: glycosyl hydrolase family 65 protein [Armatimonadota bacterium]|jgi:trehalose/maltose hydrolase-like predicted phosphorylase